MILGSSERRYRPVGLENSLLARLAALVDELESVPEVTNDGTARGLSRLGIRAVSELRGC
jgi:hypothetical protein